MPAGKAPKTNYDAMKKKKWFFIVFSSYVASIFESPETWNISFPAGIYLLKVTMKTPEQCWKFVQS